MAIIAAGSSDSAGLIGPSPAIAASGRGHAPPVLRGQYQEFRVHPAPVEAPEIGFSDSAAAKLGLADFRGRVILVNFWATWCAPCVEEMPALDRLQARLGGPDFEVVAISIDRQGLPLIVPFLDRLGIKALKHYLDPSGASPRTLKVRGLPTTILIGRDGREIGRLEGAATWDSAAAEAFIRYYLTPSDKGSPPTTTRSDAG
ncbi:MAG: TlpA family protein disulfide reductase [Rhodospirillales bacterium]|nr:TlpA family protein disulfide reductase [Rhodospirillales bacterium]